MMAGSQEGRRLAQLGLITSITSRVIGRSIGLLLVVLLAREGDAGTVALYGYLLGTAALVAILTDLGVAAVAAREVAAGRLPAREALFAALLPHTASVAAAAVVTLGLALLAGPPGIPPAALLLTVVIVVATGYVALWAELLRATGRVAAEGCLQIVGAVFLAAGGVVVIYSGRDATWLLLVVAVKEVGLTAVSVALLRPRRDPAVRSRPLLRHSLLLAVATAGVVLLWRQGTVVLGAAGTVGALAGFVVATRFLDAGIIVAQSAAVGLAPGMTMLAADPVAFRHTARRYLGLAAGVGLLVAVTGALLARPVTTVLFGERWGGASSAVAVVALTGLPVLLSYVAWPLLLARRQVGRLATASLIGVVSGTALSIALVASRPEALSAVIGTAVGASVLATILLSGLRDVLLPERGANKRTQPAEAGV